MNFNLTEEQVLLRDSIERYINDQYGFEHRREVAEDPAGRNLGDWKSFAELGWLSIPFSEAVGGYGGGAVDTMVIMEQLGRGLVLEPYLETVLLFGGLVEHGADSDLAQSVLSELIEGNVSGAFAYHERQSRYELADIKTRAVEENGVWLLTGEKAVVFNGANADKLVVSARVSGAQFDPDGIALFLVDTEAEGLKKASFRMMDGRLVANLDLQQVPAQAQLVDGERGYTIMESVVQRATVALCAEAVGIMDKLKDDTIEYTRTREQFGVSIGSFQALQHRMVDMFADCEQTRSLLYRTVCSMDEGAEDVSKNVHALKVMVGRAGKNVGAEAIQLHGGMGMTDELAVGHYVKRLMMINTCFGDADYHLQRFARLANQDSCVPRDDAQSGVRAA